jgi:glycosyltransferase involved in cell wall biosynthesis
MKIIFITREGYRLPGARIRCYNFSRELSKYGIDTEVLSFSDSLGAKDGEEESRMGLKDKIRYNWEAFRRLAADKKAILYIQRFNYHSLAPYLACLFNKNRFVLDLDDWEMRENPKYYLGFYPSSKAHYFIRQIAKRSILCIAASRFLEKFLLEFNKKVYYIPSGVDTELFNVPLNSINEKEIVFSWIGTLHKKEYVENIKFALDCFSALRKNYDFIYFDIVGDGIYNRALREIVSRFQDSHIRLKGWITPGTIPMYLANIHVGLLAVSRDTKFNRAKSPTKLFEYMAMVKPTVSSNIGEAAEIIQDKENGFSAKTKEEFIEKMQKLIEDPDLRQKMGKRARETVERNYSLKVLGKRLSEILKTI